MNEILNKIFERYFKKYIIRDIKNNYQNIRNIDKEEFEKFYKICIHKIPNGSKILYENITKIFRENVNFFVFFVFFLFIHLN